MDSTNIDKKFFSLYERGGMVDKCIYYVQSNDKGLNVLVFWTYYDELPKQYRANEEYIRAMMYSGSSPLIDKIEADLEKCTNQQETERCIFRLLTPFKRLADMLNDSKFVELLNSNSTDDVVCVLVNMTRAFYTYANRLYAMLIQHGIDLMQYQQRANIYLKRQWSVADIELYIGSKELAEYYLNQLPQKQQQRPGNSTGQTLTQHFHCRKADDVLLLILEALTTADRRGKPYLAADTTEAAWLYVCKGTPTTEQVKPLDWLADQNELALMVEKLFGTYWETAKACFRVKGNEPNVKSMANDRSKINSGKKDEPKKHTRLLRIMNFDSTAGKQ